jgi:hypothetical protein
MNILISSNTENKVGGKNFNNDFVVSLPEIIDAENSAKSIRVLNVAYPKTIENVMLEKCGIKLNFIVDVDFNNDQTEAKFTTDWLFLPAGQYSLENMILTLNMLTNEYDVFFFLLNGGRVGVNFGATVTHLFLGTLHSNYQKYVLKKLSNCIDIEMTETMKYMLGLSKLVLHPDVAKHKQQAITPLLSDWLYISNYLISYRSINREYTLVYGKYSTDITNGINTIFIYCDEVARSVVGDTNSRLLTCVHIQKDNAVSGELVSYTPPAFVTRLVNSKIEKLHITLRDTEYNLIQFSAGTVNISCVVE